MDLELLPKVQGFPNCRVNYCTFSMTSTFPRSTPPPILMPHEAPGGFVMSNSSNSFGIFVDMTTGTAFSNVSLDVGGKKKVRDRRNFKRALLNFTVATLYYCHSRRIFVS